MDLRDHYVQFRLEDIYLPDPLTVVYEMHRNDVVRGRVIEMSDCGEREGAFVVVEVDGIGHRMVVPIERVEVKD